VRGLTWPPLSSAAPHLTALPWRGPAQDSQGAIASGAPGWHGAAAGAALGRGRKAPARLPARWGGSCCFGLGERGRRGL